ncbi:hypothetical protein ACG7TL_004509 [Trametes sanguinea]
MELLPIGSEPDMNKPQHKAATDSLRTGACSTSKVVAASPSMQPGTAGEERIRRQQAKKLQEQASLPQVLQRADASSSRPVGKDLQRTRSGGGDDDAPRTASSRPPLNPPGKPMKSDPVTIRCTTTPIDAPYAMTTSSGKTSKASSSASGTTSAKSWKPPSPSAPSHPVIAHSKSASSGSALSKTSSTGSRKDGPEWTAVKSTITPILSPVSLKPKPPPAPPSQASSSRPRAPDSSLSTPPLRKDSSPSSSSSSAATHALGNGQSVRPSASSSGTSSSLRPAQALAERMQKEKEAHDRLIETLARITDMARNRKPFTCEDASRSLAEKARLRAAGQAQASAWASTPTVEASQNKAQSQGIADVKAPSPSTRAAKDAPLKPSTVGVKSSPPPAALPIAKLKPATPPAVQAKVPASPVLKPRPGTATTVNAKTSTSTQAIAPSPSAGPSKSSATSVSTTAAPAAPKAPKAKSDASTTMQTGVAAKPAPVSFKAIAIQTEPSSGSTRSTRDVGASTFSPLPSPRLSKAQEPHVSRSAAAAAKRPVEASTAAARRDSTTPSSDNPETSHARMEMKSQPTVGALKPKPKSVLPAPAADSAAASTTLDTKASRAVEKPKFVSAFLTRPLQPKASESRAPGPGPPQIFKDSRAKESSYSASSQKPKDGVVFTPKATAYEPQQREEKTKGVDTPPGLKAAVQREVEVKKAQSVAVLSPEVSTHSGSTKSSYHHDSRERSHHHSPSSSYRPPVQAEDRSRLNALKREDSRRTSASSDGSVYTTHSSSSEDTIARFIRAFPPVPSTPAFPAEAIPFVGTAGLRQPSATGSHVPRKEGKGKSPSTAARRPSTADAHDLPSMFTMSIASDSGSTTSTIRRPSTSDAACLPSAMSMREVTRHHPRISKADTVLSAAASISEARPPLPDTASDVVSYASLNLVSRSDSRSKGSRTGKMSKLSSAASSEAAIVKGDASHSDTPRLAASASLKPTAVSPSNEKTAPLRSIQRSSAEGKASSRKEDAPASATRVATSSASSKLSPSVPPRSSSAIATESIRKLEERIAKLEALSANRAPAKSSMKARADLVSCRLSDSFALVDAEEVADVDENGAGPSRLPAGKAVRFNVKFPNRSESTLSTEPAEAESSSSATPALRTNRVEESADGPPRYSSLSPLKSDFEGSPTSLPARERRRRSRSDVTEQLRHVNSVPFLCRSGDRLQEFRKTIGKGGPPVFGNEQASRSLTWLPMKSSQSLPLLEDRERAGQSKAKKLWTKAKNGLGLGKKEEPKLPPLDFSWVPKPDPLKPRLPPHAWPTEKKRHVIW